MGDRKPFKIKNITRSIRKDIFACSLEELRNMAAEKFEKPKMLPTIHLDSDGTEVDDEEYYRTLEANAELIAVFPGETWIDPHPKEVHVIIPEPCYAAACVQVVTGLEKAGEWIEKLLKKGKTGKGEQVKQSEMKACPASDEYKMAEPIVGDPNAAGPYSAKKQKKANKKQIRIPYNRKAMPQDENMDPMKYFRVIPNGDLIDDAFMPDEEAQAAGTEGA